MGGGHGAGYGNSSFRKLKGNIDALKQNFKVSPSGYFGVRSRNGDVRLITSGDRLSTSRRFFEIASRGADSTWTDSSGTSFARFSDGSTIVWRETSHSQDNSPAIRIHLSNDQYGIAPIQRIHFV